MLNLLLGDAADYMTKPKKKNFLHGLLFSFGNEIQTERQSLSIGHLSLDTQDCTERSLKKHISNLRKKLQDAGGTDCLYFPFSIEKSSEKLIITRE